MSLSLHFLSCKLKISNKTAATSPTPTPLTPMDACLLEQLNSFTIISEALANSLTGPRKLGESIGEPLYWVTKEHPDIPAVFKFFGLLDVTGAHTMMGPYFNNKNLNNVSPNDSLS